MAQEDLVEIITHLHYVVYNLSTTTDMSYNLGLRKGILEEAVK